MFAQQQRDDFALFGKAGLSHFARQNDARRLQDADAHDHRESTGDHGGHSHPVDGEPDHPGSPQNGAEKYGAKRHDRIDGCGSDQHDGHDAPDLQLDLQLDLRPALRGKAAQGHRPKQGHQPRWDSLVHHFEAIQNPPVGIAQAAVMARTID